MSSSSSSNRKVFGKSVSSTVVHDDASNANVMNNNSKKLSKLTSSLPKGCKTAASKTKRKVVAASTSLPVSSSYVVLERKEKEEDVDEGGDDKDTSRGKEFVYNRVGDDKSITSGGSYVTSEVASYVGIAKATSSVSSAASTSTAGGIASCMIPDYCLSDKAATLIATLSSLSWQDGSPLQTQRSGFAAAAIRRESVAPVAAADPPSESAPPALISSYEILVAGGKGRKGVPLDSIEIYDPINPYRSRLLPFRLSIERHACGVIPLKDDALDPVSDVATHRVSNNDGLMCVVGGRDRHGAYLSSVELITDNSTHLLRHLRLPEPRAMFEVCIINHHVYVMGGQNQNKTVLDTILVANLHSFTLSGTSGWQSAGTMSSPRRSFATLVDKQAGLVFSFGGFNGTEILNTADVYSAKHRRSKQYKYSTLLSPRVGNSAFAVEDDIVICGGSSQSNKTVVSSSVNRGASSVAASSEVLIRETNTFHAIQNVDTDRSYASLVRLGTRMCVMGGIDSKTGRPGASVSFLQLASLLAVSPDSKDIIYQPPPYPKAPILPMNPQMSTDPEERMRSLKEWEMKIETAIQLFRVNVTKLASEADHAYEILKDSCERKIQLSTEALATINPDDENKDDADTIAKELRHLKSEYLRTKAEIERGLEARIQSRNDAYNAKIDESNDRVQKLQTDIAKSLEARDCYRDKIDNNILGWTRNQRKQMEQMQAVFSGNATVDTVEVNGPIVRVDFTEDRKRLKLALTLENYDPVEVSSEYGRHCTEDYDGAKMLGQGAFGAVYKGTDHKLGNIFAFKKISLSIGADPGKLHIALKSFRREISTLKRVRHPNIIGLYGYHLKPDSEDSFLIYELAGRGNLRTYLRTEKGRLQLPYLRRIQILVESLRALNFLHTRGCDGFEIQHRDIKPDNICLSDDWSTKLIDCGLARIVNLETKGKDAEKSKSPVTVFSAIGNFAGTQGYMCRQYRLGQPYQNACDIYSFGVVMMELVVGGLNQHYDKLRGDFYYHFVETINGDAIAGGAKLLADHSDDLVVWDTKCLQKICALACSCLQKNMEKRPTAHDLLAEMSLILFRGELGELTPGDYDSLTSSSNSSTLGMDLRCVVCNNASEKSVTCTKGHVICARCITQEALVASNCGRPLVPCPVLRCRSNPFEINGNLYGVIPKEIYNKSAAEGRIMASLERIESGQKRVMSMVSNVRRGVNRGLQALASLTANGTSPCPKLVYAIPDPQNLSLFKDLKTWLKALKEIPIKLYFVCEHSLTPISTPVVMTVPRKWLQKIAPALKMSLFVLKIASRTSGIPLFGFDEVTKAFLLDYNIDNEFVNGLLGTVEKDLLESTENLFGDGIDCSQETSNKVKVLTGQSYEMIADGVRTGRQLGWQDEMKPVYNKNNARIWVKNEYVDRPEYNI